MESFDYAKNQIINTFPIFCQLMSKFEEDRDQYFKWMLEQVYELNINKVDKPLWTFYKEFTLGIEQFVNQLKEQYKEPNTIMVADYLEFVYSTMFYDTFLETYKKLPDSDKNEEILEFFYLIIVVEHFKYQWYQSILNRLPADSDLLWTIRKRIKWCLLKIGFSYKILNKVDNPIGNKTKEFIDKQNVYYWWDEVDMVQDYFQICDEF